ncbi:substrate-binding domain-containing protein [Spirillospora sp. NPDC127200]
MDTAIAAGRGVAGRLRVGFSAAWNGTLLVAAADVFADLHPDCEVRVQEVPFGDPFGGLDRGELDLQLSALPAAEPGITVGPTLFREARALVVAAGHPFAERESISLEDLADGTNSPNAPLERSR